jgi:hypothetical protein
MQIAPTSSEEKATGKIKERASTRSEPAKRQRKQGAENAGGKARSSRGAHLNEIVLLASCYGSCSRPDIFPMSLHFPGSSWARPCVFLFFTGPRRVHPESETRK